MTHRHCLENAAAAGESFPAPPGADASEPSGCTARKWHPMVPQPFEAVMNGLKARSTTERPNWAVRPVLAGGVCA